MLKLLGILFKIKPYAHINVIRIFLTWFGDEMPEVIAVEYKPITTWLVNMHSENWLMVCLLDTSPLYLLQNCQFD